MGRRFVAIDTAIEAEDSDPTSIVLQAIAKNEDDIKDAIVRLNITLPAEIEGQLRDTDIRNDLKEAHYFTIAKEV